MKIRYISNYRIRYLDCFTFKHSTGLFVLQCIQIVICEINLIFTFFFFRILFIQDSGYLLSNRYYSLIPTITLGNCNGNRYQNHKTKIIIRNKVCHIHKFFLPTAITDIYMFIFMFIST